MGYPGRPRATSAGPLRADRGLGGLGWTQGIDYFCNCGKTATTRCRPSSPGGSRTATRSWPTTPCRGAQNNDGEHFFIDPDAELRPRGLGPQAQLRPGRQAELPFGKGRRFGIGRHGPADAILGGWQVNAAVIVQSGLPFNVDLPRSPARTATRAPIVPTSSATPPPGGGTGSDQPYFNATPIGSSGSAFGRPARGTFGNLERNALTGPGYWRVDASLFKRFHLGGARPGVARGGRERLQPRQPGQPERGDRHPRELQPRPRGFITTTAYSGNDPAAEPAVRAAIPVLI